MDWLYSLLDSSTLPPLTALILGLLTAISPCPLVTNITAVAYLGREIQNRSNFFALGLLYVLGRVLAYSVLGAILIYVIRQSEDTFGIQDCVSTYGEMLLGPMLIAIGLFMLFGHLIPLPKFGFKGQVSGWWIQGYVGSLVLGVLFAMAFCPTSGLLYFGMLIPMSAAQSGGYMLPVVYAIATGLPVMLVAWVLAFSMSGISRLMGHMQTFQKWLNIVVAILFILAGAYYVLQYCGII